MEEESTEEKVDEACEAEEIIHAKGPLEMAQDYISMGLFDGAQEILNSIDEKSGKKFYLQSLIYKEKKWYNEQRKQLKKAVKAEPDNEDYKKELKELEESEEMKQYKSGLKALRKNQMGDAGDVCAEGCCEGFCYCFCAGICEGLGNGC